MTIELTKDELQALVVALRWAAINHRNQSDGKRFEMLRKRLMMSLLDVDTKPLEGK